jgi:hypothetical protein
MRNLTKFLAVLGLCFLNGVILGADFASDRGVITRDEGQNPEHFSSKLSRSIFKSSVSLNYQGSPRINHRNNRANFAPGTQDVRSGWTYEFSTNPDDAYWADGFYIQGISGSVHALTDYNGNLVAGGNFSLSWNTLTRNIAVYDGNSWTPVGTGIDSTVYALAVYDGKLIAGGDFDHAGGVEASNIAAWDGSSWTSLGSGINGWVYALTVYDGMLIVGGYFSLAGGVPVGNIAAWDGESWTAVGPGTNGAVYALTVRDETLVAGGSFSTAGVHTVNGIAKWDGESWLPLGSGMNGTIYAVAVYHNRLIAGGYFGIAGGTAAASIAAWNDTFWSPLGSGVSEPGYVYSLISYYDKLIVGGNFSKAGGYEIYDQATWNDTSWSEYGLPLPSPEGDVVYALATVGYDLFAGGKFSVIGGTLALNVAACEEPLKIAEDNPHLDAWEEPVNSPADNKGGVTPVLWYPLGHGINGPITAMCVYDDRLIAAGDFNTPDGDTFATHIAAWDGNSWTKLGSGINGSVNALFLYDGELIAGGEFDTAGGLAVQNIAAWNGSSWSALGSGVNNTVTALTVYHGDLIVGGDFDEAGGFEVYHIAAWDGSDWSSLQSRVGDMWVHALEVYEDKLIVGGEYYDPTKDGEGHGVESYDGDSWDTLGSGVSCCVYALAVYHSHLIAGGDIDQAGGNPINGIASWDGSSWSSMGDGLCCNVLSIVVYENKLIVAGMARGAKSSEPYNIAIWNGTSWASLGSGVNDAVISLVSYDTSLYVGGWFTAAGNKASAYLARWTKQYASVVVSGYVRTSDSTAIDSVTMNGLPGDPVTDSSGYYAAMVDSGWSGTVKPTKDGYTFIPDSTAYNEIACNQETNYTGTMSTYTISGYVHLLTKTAVGIDSVIMNGLPGNVQTDSTGHYSALVNYGWSGVVTPAKYGYTFAPESTSYSSVTDDQETDYLGTYLTYTISGYVRDTDSLGVEGVVLSGLPGDPETDTGGYYSAVVPYGWSGRVTPTDTCVFDPEYRDYDSVISDQSYQSYVEDCFSQGVDEDKDNLVPREYQLSQNHPNPFNPETEIAFGLPKAGFVTLNIYNILGQDVITLVSGNMSAGEYRVIWNGTDRSGRAVSSGVYFFRMQSGYFSQTKRMVLLK